MTSQNAQIYHTIVLFRAKTGGLERSPGPLEPPTPVKTGALERSPGPLESKTGALEPPAPVKTGALEPYPVWGFKNLKRGRCGVDATGQAASWRPN